MIHSLIDTDIGKAELELMNDQEHFEDIFESMQSEIERYADMYLNEIARENNTLSPIANYNYHFKNIIEKNESSKEKYDEIFSEDIMEEYEFDVDSFKGVTLKKDCTVIRKTLNSKAEALKDWKRAFYSCKAQPLYDTFYNILDFAREYDKSKNEDEMKMINTISDNELEEMHEDNCYLLGVIGTGIVSNILNHMFPRVFPGNFKIGMFALYFLSGKTSKDMGSGCSEFIMVKDDMHSKTDIIEADHNYYFPYETFALYTLRVYRIIESKILERFDTNFVTDYRFLLTNDFYSFVYENNRGAIQTLVGNDDILKFTTSV